MLYNQKTMTLKNLTNNEKNDLQKVCKELVLKGKIDWNDKFIKFWMENTTHDQNQRLLIAATAMPQRLLLSLIMEE